MKRILRHLLLALALIVPTLAIGSAAPASASHGCYVWMFEHTNYNWYTAGADKLVFCNAGAVYTSFSFGPSSWVVHLPYSCVEVYLQDIDGNNLVWMQGPIADEPSSLSWSLNDRVRRAVLVNNC